VKDNIPIGEFRENQFQMKWLNKDFDLQSEWNKGPKAFHILKVDIGTAKLIVFEDNPDSELQIRKNSMRAGRRRLKTEEACFVAGNPHCAVREESFGRFGWWRFHDLAVGKRPRRYRMVTRFP
jgi:hypothetical protein